MGSKTGSEGGFGKRPYFFRLFFPGQLPLFVVSRKSLIQHNLNYIFHRAQIMLKSSKFPNSCLTLRSNLGKYPDCTVPATTSYFRARRRLMEDLPILPISAELSTSGKHSDYYEGWIKLWLALEVSLYGTYLTRSNCSKSKESNWREN